jgi:hypothetical protein
MSKFTDHLWQDLVREHGPTLVQADRPQPGRAGGRLLRRPRVLAGSTLGLAGVAAALVLALSGTAATTPALAVTRQDDGSVLVKVNADVSGPWLAGADKKLAEMGTGEQIIVSYAPGPAPVSGPVTCKPMDRANPPQGPPVKVLFGNDGTQVIPANITGAGTAHISSCGRFQTPVPGGGNTGNTGAG